MTPNVSDQEPHELPCAGKLAFDSKAEAEASATVVLYRYGTILNVYICQYCGLWHLASS